MPIIPPQRLAQHLLPHKNTLDMRLLIREEHRTCFDHRKSEKELGLSFSAIVFVTLREVTRQAIADFEAALPKIPQIIEAQRLFGDPDYLLQVITKDLPAFQRLYDEHLTSLPNVQRLVSTLVMKNVINDRVLPL